MASNTEIEKLERRWLENPLGLTFATLAEAYRKGGDTARALEVLEVGLAQHPNYVPAHIVRGRCHFDGQNDTEAESAFLRVLELDPENVIALKGLAELSERGGRMLEAAQRLAMLVEVDRNNEEARGQLDRVRELLAAKSQERPIAEVPEEPVAVRDAPVEVVEVVEAVQVQEVVEIIEVAGVAEEVPSRWARETLDRPAEMPTEAPAEELVEEPVSAVDEGRFFDDLEKMDPDDIHPEEGTEFQIPSDAEALRPSSERFADVLLTPDAPILESGLGSVDGLLGGDYASLVGFQQPAEAPEIVAPIVAEVHEPIVEVSPPPPPPPYSAFEPVPEAVMEPGAEQEPVAEPEEPELVVTETMAEIFLRQGHRELALAVYQQLAQRDPFNQRIAEAVVTLTPEAPAPEPLPEPEPVRVYAAAETGGTPVGVLLGTLFKAQRPTAAAAIHPPAFETPRRGSGEPTRPGQDSLSLSAVFGDEAGPTGPASPVSGTPGSEPSFDEFFAPATGSSADTELPKAPSEAGAVSAPVPEDLEQFNAWLRGLKR